MASEALVVLDVRGLAPPEPLERILDALTELPPGGCLRVRHQREPFPLYDLLRRLDQDWRTRWVGADFELLIWARLAPPAALSLDGWDMPC